MDDRDGGYIYETYFFIQKVPESEDKLEDEIRTFISENKIIEDAKSAGANSLTLKFMEPDFRMPVYFKENSSFIKKDDYAEHYYKTNMTAIYNYDFDDDTEMMDFSKVKHSL
ncbi:hypothetical protein [Ruminococcus albus]|uniref:Uncharacterized protein n=1 Tax=Ruminococcus albus TaxID=1264 RepID=A0A1H7MLP0_RUMAL|nr:hypothetical protein [Ruminococcus albus]SEL11605.1 hypothetical protein SAMN05216469_11223 [Ruminococcus albus]